MRLDIIKSNYLTISHNLKSFVTRKVKLRRSVDNNYYKVFSKCHACLLPILYLP